MQKEFFLFFFSVKSRIEWSIITQKNDGCWKWKKVLFDKKKRLKQKLNKIFNQELKAR